LTPTVDELRKEVQGGSASTGPRVLVATLGIAAEGLNLARANYVVIVDPSWAETTHDQAFRRVDRDGQLFTPRLYMLLDHTNQAEALVRQRQLKRAAIETGVWEARS
jgi:hypothetical protein